jgi:hypothetical protein
MLSSPIYCIDIRHSPKPRDQSSSMPLSTGELVAKYLVILLEEGSLAESGLRQEINLH